MKLASNLESNTSKAAVTPGEIIPADELLADLYLALNKPKKALESYKKNLEEHPFRFNGIYGAAKAAEKLNDIKLAVYYFDQLQSHKQYKLILNLLNLLLIVEQLKDVNK